MSPFNTWLGKWALKYYRLSLSLIFCYTLASCSFTPEQTHIIEPDWEISGKIGIKENSHRASASLFQWQQKDNQYVIYLFNTLGQTQLTLSGNNRYARIETMDGETSTANTPEELLEQVTGWHFPISSMRYWIQGKDGNLDTFNTVQWQASIQQYKPVAKQLLPHRIKLQQDDLKITLIIKQHANFNP